MATTVTLKPNAIDISGSTSGTTTLQATAVAGTTTITLPAATDTLVGKATTDTLTNKTLTSPTLTTPVLGTPSSGTLTNCTGLPNAGLVNSSVTVGSTAIALGATATTLAGLTSVASNTLTSASATNLVLQAAGTTAITVNNSTGNVSINAGASPTAKLAVTTGTGSSLLTAFSDGVAQTLQIGTSSTGLYFNNSNSGYQAFQIGSTEAMRIASDSSILVNTSTNSASTKVAILGSSTVNGISVRDGTVAGNYESSDATRTSYWQFGRDNVSTGNFVFTYNGSQKVAIDTSGNFFVGKTTYSDTSGNGFGVFPNSGIPQVSCVGAANSTQKNFTVYSSTDSGYKFFVTYAGVVNAVTTTISGISDQRLKENIVDLDVGLNAVMALKPRKFDWKEGKGANTKNARGFIAQEFETVFPDLIDEWADPAPKGELPYKSVRVDLIPVLVKAIQEQQALITAQAETINALTARIVALESK